MCDIVLSAASMDVVVALYVISRIVLVAALYIVKTITTIVNHPSPHLEPSCHPSPHHRHRHPPLLSLHVRSTSSLSLHPPPLSLGTIMVCATSLSLSISTGIILPSYRLNRTTQCMIMMIMTIDKMSEYDD